MAKKFMEVAKAEGLQVNEVISANIVLSYILESFTLLDFVGYEGTQFLGIIDIRLTIFCKFILTNVFS
jgi:hypothetical protein